MALTHYAIIYTTAHFPSQINRTADVAERNESAEIVCVGGINFPSHAMQYHPSSDFSAVSFDLSLFSNSILSPN
jgi:hypothetical protein